VSHVALRKGGGPNGSTKSHFDNKQECELMKRKGAEGLTAGPPAIWAANEEFTDAMVSRLDAMSYSRSGWDPYEVWRTRVKASSRPRQEREPDPLR
jgi:hypothetical protein